jgi:hypothetical protein
VPSPSPESPGHPTASSRPQITAPSSPSSKNQPKGGGYAGVVLGLGQLVGRDSSLAVAAATLAVAAVFQPARRRIQQAVDRRFNRRGHDAAQEIAAFSDRLREQVDLDALAAELLAVAEETMQPTRASLWLRSPQEPPRALAQP